ncbi:MAG TPA: hypothetical protein VKJ47_05945 [Candidatus Binatia bacterium]|nr:hypothetical protein [Candidatus Binatia bacterium]
MEGATLSDRHGQMLRTQSGLADEVIQSRGYRTVVNTKDLIALGFSQGKLTPYRVGPRKTLIRRADLEHFLAQSRADGDEQ